VPVHYATTRVEHYTADHSFSVGTLSRVLSTASPRYSSNTTSRSFSLLVSAKYAAKVSVASSPPTHKRVRGGEGGVSVRR
jgi:hypothetical protein